MAGKLPRAAMICLALTALTLSACDSGLKIGSWQIIDPKPTFSATRIEIERWQLAPPGKAHGSDDKPVRAYEQRLALDLLSGRAAFTDANGKIYPLQLDPGTVKEIRDFILSREWQTAPIGPEEKAEHPFFFALTVYNGNERVHHQGFWSAPVRDTENLFNDDDLAQDQGLWATPSEKPLPAGFVFLEQTFDQAVRVAHPLSDKVNLLK